MEFLDKLRTQAASENFDFDADLEPHLLLPDDNRFGFTSPPLYYATTHGWCSSIRWLLDQGANVHGRHSDIGSTPLQVAARLGRTIALPPLYHRNRSQPHHDAALMLLNAGARVDAGEGVSGQGTALHRAAWRADVEMCKLLLSRGASLQARNAQGTHPYPLNHLDEDFEEAHDDVYWLFSKVIAAGGWRPYVDAPRRDLLVLRRALPSLRERGRATQSGDALYERLFHDTRVPEEIFVHVFTYWRTPRDYELV